MWLSGSADEDAERQQRGMGRGDLGAGGRAGDADLMLVDDGGAAEGSCAAYFPEAVILPRMVPGCRLPDARMTVLRQ